MEGSSKITQNSRPLTPVDINKRSPVKQKALTSTTLNVSPPTPQVESPTVTPVHDEPKAEEAQKEQSKIKANFQFANYENLEVALVILII